MTLKTCFRCDWHGDTEEASCPNCGVKPLFVADPSPSRKKAMPVGGYPEEPRDDVASTARVASSDPPRRSDPSPSPAEAEAEAVEPVGRSPRSAVAFILVALVLTVTLGTWLNAHEERAAPAASAAVAVQQTPASDGPPSPTPASVGLSDGPLALGRHSLTAEGVPLSFIVPTDGWESHHDTYISKSSVGPQGAEAMIYWTSLDEGDHADPCGQWWGSSVGNMADSATQASKLSGTELVRGPSAVTVGGQAAEHVVFTVRKDVACNPGFLYHWQGNKGGAFWLRTEVGDTIRIWLVDIDGKLLYIEGDTHKRAGAALEQEVQQIVRSIRFREPFFVELRTGEETPLAENLAGGHNFAASPDGTTLAYAGTSNGGSPQIFIAGIHGSGVRQMTHDPTGAAWPAWSPDGTKIAYGGYGGGGVRNLFVLDVGNGMSTQITDGPRDEQESQFTPDGSSLLYTGGTDQAPVLMTAPVAGGESTLLIGPGERLTDAGNGSLSPDGSLVTFQGSGGPFPGASHCGPCRLVANADGTEIRVILGCHGSIPAGTWSPDGSRIVCSSGHRIIVVDIATGEATPVATGSGAIWVNQHTLLVEA